MTLRPAGQAVTLRVDHRGVQARGAMAMVMLQRMEQQTDSKPCAC